MKTLLLLRVMAVGLIAGVFASDDPPAKVFFPPVPSESYNFWDDIWVTYTSTWPSGANISAQCFVNPGADQVVGVSSPSSLSQSGTIEFHALGEEMSASIKSSNAQSSLQYPAACWIALQPANPDDVCQQQSATSCGGKNAVNSLVLAGNFTLTSDQGLPATDRMLAQKVGCGTITLSTDGPATAVSTITTCVASTTSLTRQITVTTTSLDESAIFSIPSALSSGGQEASSPYSDSTLIRSRASGSLSPSRNPSTSTADSGSTGNSSSAGSIWLDWAASTSSSSFATIDPTILYTTNPAIVGPSTNDVPCSTAEDTTSINPGYQPAGVTTGGSTSVILQTTASYQSAASNANSPSFQPSPPSTVPTTLRGTPSGSSSAPRQNTTTVDPTATGPGPAVLTDDAAGLAGDTGVGLVVVALIAMMLL